MATFVRHHWANTYAPGLSRRDRASCDFDAYVPDPLLSRTIQIDGDTAADIADAETALARFDTEATSLADTEALARLLLRAESVASSRIEGLQVGPRRLLHAEVARSDAPARDHGTDVTATEVLNNIDAMRWAVGRVKSGDDISLTHLLEAHRRLLADTRLADHGGRLRTEQNWIGGSSYNPCAATFVPPPPTHVPELLEDLVAFCNTDALPPVAQAALAHAQFETIHPFVDGNGRIGRVLIHLVLRRRGATLRTTPPISLVLATRSDDYVSGLSGTRWIGPPDSTAAHHGSNAWLALFASVCRNAVAHATAFEAELRSLKADWRRRLGRVRADSATDRLIEALPGAPVLTVDAAAALVGRTFGPANQAIGRLVDAGILTQTTVGRRNRAFEAPDVIDAFVDLERQLASPAGDTRLAPPNRPAPHRR